MTGMTTLVILREVTVAAAATEAATTKAKVAKAKVKKIYHHLNTLAS